MKFTTLTKTLFLLGITFFILGADYITRDMIPKGSDVSTIRCNGRLVSIGDLSRDVFKKCGEPIKETRILDEPYHVWVYRLGQSDHVYYLAFMYEKLQRIYDVKCREDNPDCK
jgi:hypothetical protein